MLQISKDQMVSTKVSGKNVKLIVYGMKIHGVEQLSQRYRFSNTFCTDDELNSRNCVNF